MHTCVHNVITQRKQHTGQLPVNVSNVINVHNDEGTNALTRRLARGDGSALIELGSSSTAISMILL